VQRAARRLGWLSLAVILLFWIMIRFLGDDVWWTLPVLYGPRWLYTLVMLGVIPWLVTAPRRAALPVLVGAVLAVFGVLDWRIGLGGLTAGDGPALRVLELNAGAGSGGLPNLNDIINELKARDPDIIVIAECGLGVSDSLPARFPGYTIGVAAPELCLAVRGEIQEFSQRDQLDLWKKGGAGEIVRAILVTRAGPVRLGMVHLATPRNALDNYLDLSTIPSLGPVTRANIDERDEESRDARDWIMTGPAMPTIITGDFNIPVESAIYRRYWASFRNAFSASGRGTGYTKHTRLWGVRIDHVLMTKDIHAVRSFTGKDVGSDHLPVIADLRLPQRTSTAR
jgi:hypothetical protein